MFTFYKYIYIVNERNKIIVCSLYYFFLDVHVNLFKKLDGILRKDPANIIKEGLGMNPNLNVEDEYIENLLKQIHFLGLEIKLL